MHYYYYYYDYNEPITFILCSPGFLLLVVDACGRPGNQPGVRRHRGHLRLGLEPTERPAGAGQSAQDRPEETGEPPRRHRANPNRLGLNG